MSRDLTISDLSTSSGEPRVRDIELGFSLGMKNPASALRQMIDRHRAELEQYGEVSAIAAETSAKGGRPGRAYLLNEAQALLVCMFARTPRAAAVRRQVIEVFTAYRRGELAPPSAGIEARLARIESLLSSGAPASHGMRHALALADAIEHGLRNERHDDGMHLGPTDLTLVVAHLRGTSQARFALPRPARVPREALVDFLRRVLREAGKQGITRALLTKRLNGRWARADVNATLAELRSEGELTIRSVRPRTGRPGTLYRFREIGQ